MSYYYNESGEKTPITPDIMALFRPKMSNAEKAHYLQWLQSIMSAFPFTYMLAAGSLLGSLVYEGFIPWDDDFDIYCHWEDYDQIKHWAEHKMNCLWHNMNPVVPSETQFQISKLSPKNPLISYENEQYPWGWPSIDIFWLERTSKNTRKRFFKEEEHPLQDLYPLRWGTFQGQSLSIPHAAEKVLIQKYPNGLVHAIPPWHDHMHEKEIRSFCHILLPLRNLATLYPILNKTLPKLEAMGYIDPKA